MKQIVPAVLLTLGLTACQQEGPSLSMRANNDIIAAGFIEVPDAKPGSAIYHCSAKNCGAPVIAEISVKDVSHELPAGLTAEQALMTGRITTPALRKLFAAQVAQLSSAARINSFSVDRSNAEVHFTYRAPMDGRNVLVGNIIKVRGNTASGLGVMSAKPALVQRYLRRQWIL